MIIERFFTSELAQVAYAVGDRDAGEVAIVDPRRDIDEYVSWASAQSLRIVAVLETHVHADFVSGAPALARETGAPVYASRMGEQDFDHIPVDDGLVVEIGAVRLTAIHTPGHTPEHMSWQADDTGDPDASPVLFSGDALFVGDVGRPDLLGEEHTEGLVDSLYDTVTNIFKRMPDDMIVYPGHTAGSSCGKNIGSAPYTRIGLEKAMNYAFKPETRAAFAEAVMSGMPDPPTYYPVLKQVNKRGATPLDQLEDMAALTVEGLEDGIASGAMVIDVRSKSDFGSGHIPGSQFVGTDGSFATWMGWFAPYDRELILVASDARQAREARTMLLRIGIDRVVGYFAGIDRWRESGRELGTVDLVSVEELARERERGNAIVLDVRSDEEYEDRHIPGAKHLYLPRIIRGALPEVDRATEVTVVCGTGYRSMIAASILQDAGYERVRDLDGGMVAWGEADMGADSIAS